MSTSKHILLVEDDLNLGYLISESLEEEGYEVKLCRDGHAALQQLRRRRFDLGILDVMLPQMDGFSFARTLRNKGWELPFIFLTAKTRKEDLIRGYDCGAEDYILKPFDEDVLKCKIEAILRRTATSTTPKDHRRHYTLGRYSFQPHLQALGLGEELIRLTEKESEVLHLLCQHQNRILRRDQALMALYGKNDYFLGRSFDVFISKLRKRLSSDQSVSIENVYRVGFILRTPEGK